MIKDDKGQIIVILAVIICVLLASLSLLYAQNMLAGNESAYSQLSSPSPEIENLKNMVDELESLAKDNAYNPDAFMRYAEALNEQVKALYASHGSYADIEVYNVSMSCVVYDNVTDNCVVEKIKSFNVKIVFSNPEVEYEEVKIITI
jgi:hypothetical protein